MEELATSVPLCQYPCNGKPTWKPDGRLSWSKLGLSEEARQQNLHHHHYHYHYYQYAAACSCPSNGLSPPTAQQAEADFSQRASANKHTHIHVPSQHKVHPHCPFKPLPSRKHSHCPQCPGSLPPKEHTCSSICPPTEHTLLSLTSDPHTHTHLPHPTEYLTPSTERAWTPAIPPSQTSSPDDADLYNAVPQLHAKKPKKAKPQSKRYPPFPSLSAPPYILCQHCFKVLSLPLSPPLHLLMCAPVLKLKCALCTRTSVFSTRRHHPMPSAADPCQLGKIDAFKKSEGDMAGDFQFKIEACTSDADASISFSPFLEDEGSLLGLKQNSMDAHVPTTFASVDASGTEQRIHVPIINTLADGEQEVVDAKGEEMVTESRMQGNYASPQSSPKLNPEFAGFSSVQDWVNSIEQESLLHCPTPVLGTAFGSDLQLQASIDWEAYDHAHQSDMFSLPLPGSPLHEHFGYRSPSELLNKTSLSDDEIKIPSDTTSSASTSATSANTFTPPGFENTDRSECKNICKSVFVKQALKNSVKGSVDVEPSDQVFLANVFRRSIKGFVERKRLLVSSPKSRVIVNGHTLSQPALKRAEEQAGKLRPGTYWYDSKAGFWGIIGGPCLGVLPPFIEELQHPMSRDCSNGDTQIIVNGRELHHKDLTVLALRGLSRKPGMAYVIGFDGVVLEETSGQELKHLGKLAPTVERKGKGFGMYMAKQR